MMVLAVFASAFIMTFAESVFGGNHGVAYRKDKILGQIAGTLSIGFLALYSYGQTHGGPAWMFPVIILLSFGAFLSIRQWGPWGELFVNYDPVVQSGRAEWFYHLTNRIFGRRHIQCTADELKRWKVCGWMVRYSTYGLPLGGLMAFCAGSVMPLVILPFIGLVRGVVYWHGLAEKTLGWCEKISGFAVMILMGAAL